MKYQIFTGNICSKIGEDKMILDKIFNIKQIVCQLHSQILQILNLLRDI
jgi:hypothetical protein